jgi:hypothetical protein
MSLIHNFEKLESLVNTYNLSEKYKPFGLVLQELKDTIYPKFKVVENDGDVFVYHNEKEVAQIHFDDADEWNSFTYKGLEYDVHYILDDYEVSGTAKKVDAGVLMVDIYPTYEINGFGDVSYGTNLTIELI